MARSRKGGSLTPTDRDSAKASSNAHAQAVPASVSSVRSGWRRRDRLAVAWGVALVVVVGLSAWLALRGGTLTADVPSSGQVQVEMQAQALPLVVVPMSVEQLLTAGRAADWRVARLSNNTAVLAIEFPNLLAQGQSFNRTAALIEKKGGARGQILTDAELAALVASTHDNTETFYQGHDYTGVNLARLYSLAARQSMRLNAQELRLRNLLLQEGVIREQSPGVYEAIGTQAVISFSAVQPDNPATPQDEAIDPQRRASVLLHEFSHGQFFTRPDYRKACWKFWTDVLGDGERQMFRDYLAKQDYDPENEELMVNETQALLMHTPDPRAFNAAAMGVSETLLERWRGRFRQVGAPAAVAVGAGVGLPR